MPGDRRAPVVPDDERLLLAEGVYQADDVADQVEDGVRVDGVGVVAAAVATLIGGDHAEARVGQGPNWWRQECHDSGKPCSSTTKGPSPCSAMWSWIPFTSIMRCATMCTSVRAVLFGQLSRSRARYARSRGGVRRARGGEAPSVVRRGRAQVAGEGAAEGFVRAESAVVGRRGHAVAVEEELLCAVEADAFDPAGGCGVQFGPEQPGQVPGADGGRCGHGGQAVVGGRVREHGRGQ